MSATNSPDLKNLSPEQKRELLAKLLKKKAAKQPQRTAQKFPLSFAQQRLWFIDQLQTGQAVYTIPAALRLQGNLNVDILQRCLDEIVTRHEVLRTQFVTEAGAPSQQVQPPTNVNLPVIVLDGASDNLEQQIRPYLKALVELPFDLATGQLLRCQLIRLSATDHVLALGVHHIVADYWSLRVFMKEIALLYQAFSQNQPSPLPALPIQYADYAVWQQQNQQTSQSQLDYWLEKLANPPSILQLPTDHPRPAVQTFHGARHSFALSKPLSDQLSALGQQHQATLFITLLAAFKVLLYRYSGQGDILVGSTVTNRDRTELQNLIGLFVNNLVFRSQIDAQLTFKQLLDQVKRTALDAYAHQEVSFEQVVDALQVERQLSRNALFQVMFILHNTPKASVSLPELNVSALEFTNNASRFDLSLDIYETEARLTGVFEYNTDLFDADTITRLAVHFETLLEGIVAAPNTTVGHLPLLPPSELETLASWNQTKIAIPEVCAHKLVEAQAARTPDASALTVDNKLPERIASQFVAPEKLWTYQQLNQSANRVARFLKTQGAVPGSRIALAFNRSAELVITLLAVLKLGGTYIPLDPTHPTERLRHILQDAHVAMVLTADKAFAEDSLPSETKLLDLKQHTELIEQQSFENLGNTTTAEDLAYIIYTSGSTGKPKGVPIRHRSLVNLLSSMAKSPGITADDALLAVTTVAFDIATLELLLPLTVGARLAIASPDTVCDASRLMSQIANDGITIMQTTPATWRLLLDSGWKGKETLKILCGGEALDPGLAQQLLPCSSELWNMYGPTETTIWSGALHITEEKLTGQTVPIGGAIDNTQFYILDAQHQPVPIGVSGELCIGGAGLSPGYLNRDELTAEKFVLNHFSGEQGSREAEERRNDFRLPTSDFRLYKTGDLARYRPNGTLEYLGRLDHQIKLRGFRIELGDIETALTQHKDIDQAFVVLWKNSSDDPQLVAYCKVWSTAIAKDPQTIRQHLSEQLPAYMIPTAYVLLEEFPLTPNGKVDRKALPEPIIESGSASAVPLKTETEQQLAAIWSEVLNQNAISASDNFFELGGHSLLAARVMARLQPIFGVTVPLRALFESSCLSALAKVIDQELGQQNFVPVQPIARTQPLPLSYAQQRQWVLAQLEPDSAFYNIPAAVRLEGDFSLEIFKESLEILCDHHESLRTGFKSVNGAAELFILPQVKPVVTYRELQGATKETITNYLETEIQKAFDLEAAPLMRVQVLRTDIHTHVVSLVLHHIIADAWSVGLLIKELVAVYDQLQKKQPVALAPLSIQYVDYATWQQNLDTKQQLNYWQQQLADSLPLLPLPTDYPRPATQQFSGSSHQFTFTEAQTTALKNLSQQHSATLFMTLLAAFKVLLHRYSGANDVLVGTPIAHRPQAELENILGMFVNTLVLRSDFSEEISFNQLLDQVKETSLAAYANQDVPFEQVIDVLNIPRNWSHSPLFQVMFVWQAATPDSLEMQGADLIWSPISLESNTTKVDLTLMMAEKDGYLSGRFEYRQDLFKSGTIEAMAEAFCTLLDAVVESPTATVSGLPLLHKHQQEQLVQWNQTHQTYGSNICLHQLFEKQVKHTPEATALVAADKRLSYQELNARSNKLAAYLISIGIGPEARVGVCLDRSEHLIVALLGILKAGGAYVPLDPAYPPSRLNYILEDADVSVVVTEQQYHELTEKGSFKVVLTSSEEISYQNTDTIVTNVQPHNLAYIIYTSGSTGQPKGVAIEHHSPVALVNWAKEVFSPDQLSGVLAATSICFDLSVFEIFVTLSSGGTIILADNVLQVTDIPAANEITLINTVPTAIAELLRIEGIPKSVSTINLAGEPIPPVLVQQLYAVDSVQQVFNLYGPSEDTTYSTYTLLSPDDAVVPIGYPIANTQTHVLDKHYNPVPIGMTGELYLAGDGVARGYWNRPELTQDKFVTSDRLTVGSTYPTAYKTGDLVRHRPDGQLEFLGRIDSQVKLRGFRIELGEIEAVLLQHPDVVQVAARVWTDEQDNRRLVAYVVLSDLSNSEEWGIAIKGSEGLRSHLQATLPDYMVPAFFIPLESLPLLPNGKLNRKALPTPVLPKQVSTETVTQTETEQKLVSIWQGLLQQSVGLHDNFFELGGDSILAIQAIARAQQMDLHFSPRDLFQYSTVAQLATIAQKHPQRLVSQKPIVGTIPLTPIQHWFFEQQLNHPHHWNQSVLLKVQQPLETEILSKALGQLMTHHDSLRATFYLTETGWQQRYGEPSTAVPIAIIRKPVGDSTVEKEIINTANAAQASFNLAKGPLWRVVYFELETSTEIERRLLIICHHLLVDGISWRILLEDLQRLYTQLNQTGMAQLPLKTLPNQDWVSQLESNDKSSELTYWKTVTQLSIPPLPRDFTDGTNIMALADTVSVNLSETDTQRLLQQVPAAYNVHINDLLLTALGLALEPWAGNQLRLAMEGHGRPADVDLTRTVGWFTTLYPVLLEIPEGDLSTTIKVVKETLRAVPDQGLGYGILRYLQANDNNLETDIPIRFNYLGQTDQLFSGSNLFVPATEPTGASRSPHDDRDMLIEINAVVSQGILKLNWTYGQEIHHRETIENLAHSYLHQLKELINHCLSSETDQGYSPADFPQMDFAQGELDDLLSSLDLDDGGGVMS
ncbi:MAG: amino acid adenylation domain-containing protein [Cyanobacteria bacterium P01_D01_bin.156]